MAFSLDTSGINIPGIPTSVPAPTSGISSTSLSLVDRITSNPGALFSNPMVGTVNFMGNSVDSVESKLQSIAAGPVIGTGKISAAEAQSYLAGQGLQDLRSSMGNFMVHTDRLSGLLQSQGISTPGLQQIMSVGRQMQTMMTLVNAASGCTSALGGATGIFSQGTIDGETSKLADIGEQISNGVATIADLTQTVTNVTNTVNGIIDKDSQFLQNCVNQLQAAAVGLAMEAASKDPCIAFLFQSVSNLNPGGLLDILSKPLAK